MNEINALDAGNAKVLERCARLRVAVTRSGGASAVAKISGVPATTIQNYMGGRDMKVDALVALSEACEVSLVWLATGIGPMQGTAETEMRCLAGFGEAIHKPMHFLGFCILLVSCQEFHRSLNASPTLAEVLEWIGPNYPKLLEVSNYHDRQVKIQPA